MGVCASQLVAKKGLGGQVKLSASADHGTSHCTNLEVCCGQDTPTFDLTALPPDILWYIKALLPARSSRALLQVPNSRLHNVLKSAAHSCKLLTFDAHPHPPKHPWFHIRLHPHQYLTEQPKMQTAFKHCTGLDTLDLSSCGSDLSVEQIIQFLSLLPHVSLFHIHTLKLGANSQHLLPASLAVLLPLMPALRSLECCLCAADQQPDTVATLLHTFASLSHLTILPAEQKLGPVLDSTILQVISHCLPPALKLDLYCWRTSITLLHSQRYTFVNIASLQLTCLGDFPHNTQGLLPRLHSVRLQCKGSVTLDTLSRSFLATAEKLRVLHLCGLEGRGDTSWMAALSRLEELVLSHVKFPLHSITPWHSLLSSLPSLSTLVVDMCSGVPECTLYPLLPPHHHHHHDHITHTTSGFPTANQLPSTPSTPTPSTPSAHTYYPSSSRAPPSLDDLLLSLYRHSSPNTSPPTSPASSHPQSPTSTSPLATASLPPNISLPPPTHPALRTLALSTHWGAGAHPHHTTIHRWLKALHRLHTPLPSTFPLTSLYLHFNNTDIEADLALPHIHALTHLPHLTLLQISTSQVRCIDSKMIPNSHIPFLTSLAAARQLRTLRLLYGWLPPPSFSSIVSSLSQITQIAWVASPDLGSTRRYLSTLESAHEGLTGWMSFVAAMRDVASHGKALGRLLECRRMEAVTAVLLESKAADRVVEHVLKNPGLLRAVLVLPRCEHEREVREAVAAPLEAAGVEVEVVFHAGCYKAWARALGDPGVLQNAESGDWRRLNL